MLSSIVILSRRALIFICCCALLFCAGCAASSTTMVEEELVSNPKPMYRYTSLVIRDLELKREMYSDTFGGGSQLEKRYAKLPGELSGYIEKGVKARGIYKNVSRDTAPDASTLLLTGKFIRLSRFKITVSVSLHDGVSNQEVASFRGTLWDVLDTTDSFADLGREVADFIYRIQYK